MSLELEAIVAYDFNKGIGRNGGIPWRWAAEDMKWFKSLTTCHCCIMGRKTFDSLPFDNGLPNRHNIVLTSKPRYEPKLRGPWMTCYVRSVEEALYVSEKIQQIESDTRIFCVGGASIYEQMIPLVSNIYVTLISGVYDCDTFFPQLDGELKVEYIKDVGDHNVYKLSRDYVPAKAVALAPKEPKYIQSILQAIPNSITLLEEDEPWT